MVRRTPPADRFIKSVIVLGFLLATATAEKISCPILQCDDPTLGGPIDYDLCWRVEED